MGRARKWTKAELDNLAEWWGKYSVDVIANRLNRSRSGVINRAVRLGLGAFLGNSEMIPFNVLNKTLGYTGSYSENLKKFRKAGLIIHRQKVRDCSFLMVDIDEFWEFAEKNKAILNFSKFEENSLGAEPAWVKAKRAEDFKRTTMIKPHNAKWTKDEDSLLLKLLREYRYTYADLSKRLQRSCGAIQRRICDLGIKERPIKADNHVLWTDDEIKTLCDMIKLGSNYENISEVLGKSSKAIRTKVFSAYLTERLSKVQAYIGDGEWGVNRPARTIKQKLLMTIEEKQELKDECGKLVSLLTYQIRKSFDDQDNWQRYLCRHWDDVKGCLENGVNCDECSKFERLRPQYCVRCGGTFFERAENKMCKNCRTQRKKAAYRKFLRESKKQK